MDIRTFTDISVEVSYINNELSNGRSISKIALEDYGYKNESSLRKKLTKNNQYKRVGNEFIKQDFVEQNIKEKAIKEVVVEDVGQTVRHNVTTVNFNEVEAKSEYENTPIVTMSQTVTDMIAESEYNGLIKNYDTIMNMVEDYKKLGVKENNKHLVIELPPDIEEARVTFRINKSIYDEFQIFVSENKQFKVKELVSAALKEFIDRYKTY